MVIEDMVWLFPLIFLVHELEEIIIIKSWTIHHQDISKKYKISISSTAAFAISVLEEYIILIIITVISRISGNYYAWFGFLAAFTIHLIYHAISCIKIKTYAPGSISSVFCFPLSAYFMYQVYCKGNLRPVETLVSIVICSIVMIVNLIIIKKNMNRFEQILKRYERQ